MGLNTGHSQTAQLLGFVKEIMEHPQFLWKNGFLLEKIWLYTWRKHWKDLYQNANRDFFLDGEIISIINVFLCIIYFIYLFILLDVCFW